ncbi:MAG: magnesium transporter, partial [Treponema sp.]|nr:magnesium transporter [Treponema sp.]
MTGKELQDFFNAEPVNPALLKSMLLDMNAADIAELFEDLKIEKIIQVFRLLPKYTASEVFSDLEADKQQILVEALTDTEVGEIINNLFADDAVDFIEEIPANVVKRVLRNVSPEKRRIINQLLQYPEDSAGSIMTTEYIDLPENATVREAFDLIRTTG